MVTRHVKSAQSSEKTFCSSQPTRTSNPEPSTLADQHNVLVEGYTTRTRNKIN